MAGSPLIADFDFTNLIISIKASGSYNAENDLYSDWKELVREDSTGFAAGVPPAFLNSVGGNDLGAGQQIAPYFFINNVDGWRLRPPEEDGETSVVGNLFPADPNTPFIVPTVGNFTQLLRLVVSPQAVVAEAPGGSLTTEQDRLIRDIHGQAQRRIYINVEQSPGGLYGYQQEPFNNWTAAVDYAETNGLQVLALETDATVDRQLKNFEIDGIGGLPQLDLNGQIMNGSTVRRCRISGAQGANGGGGGQLIAFECAFDNVSNFDGAANLCGIIGTIGFRNGTTSLMNEPLPFIAGGTVTIDLTPVESPDAGPSTIGLQNASGAYRVINMDDPGDALHITMKQGTITVEASCTAGTVVIAGEANVTDNSGPGCSVIHSAAIQPEDLHLIKGLVGGDAEVSLDDQTVTIYDNDVSPRQVLAVYNISADGRIRTRTS
jgi:hypothetical protein